MLKYVFSQIARSDRKKAFNLMPMNIIEINASVHTGVLSMIQMFIWLVVLLFDIGILKVNISSKLSGTV